MKVIHVPFCFYPDPVGGTEVYVEALARYLQATGIASVIAAPALANGTYQHQTLRVRRFAITADLPDLRMIYGAGDPLAAAEFSHVLDEERPDLVHLHAHSPAVSVHLIRAAKQRGLPVVFTYHTPTVSCQQGTLMRWNTKVCDGRMRAQTCAACTLHERGLNRVAAHALASLPVSVGSFIERRHLHGRYWTALRMSELIRLRHGAVRELFRDVDHILAVCEWVRAVLLRNDVPANKITLSRQGLCNDATDAAPAVPPAASANELRLVFLGRLHRTKGIHVVIQALQARPQLKISLAIYGTAQGEAGEQYRRELEGWAAGDSRITFHAPVKSSAVIATLRQYDLIVVPSQWMETGPMVVLEAFAAGLPVLGWNLGGIAELVTHNVNGLLIEPPGVTGWIEALERCCADPNLVRQLRSHIRPPRHMRTVAQEHATLYAGLLNGGR